MSERFVVLALGSHRAPWFQELPRLATAGSVPMEVLPCVSRGELDSHLASGRVLSALTISASSPSLDRDLIDGAIRRGVAVFIVDDLDGSRHLEDLGASRVLTATFGRGELLSALESCCAHRPSPGRGFPDPVVLHPAPLVAVTGSGGSGASTLAAALSQGLADDSATVGRYGRSGVVLLDAALHAEQAMLHGTDDVVPGLPELIDAHRLGSPGPADTLAMTYTIATRGYQLMLGMRRHRDWATLRERSTGAAITGLRSVFDVVVADVDADVESEAATGSHDIEDRNRLARTIFGQADALLVTAVATMKGVHAMCRTLHQLVAFGVPVTRVQPVFNHAPRSPRVRAELSRSLSTLAGDVAGRSTDVRPSLFVPTRRAVEMAHRDATHLPSSIVSTITPEVIDMLSAAAQRQHEPQLVIPGSLGLAESA